MFAVKMPLYYMYFEGKIVPEQPSAMKIWCYSKEKKCSSVLSLVALFLKSSYFYYVCKFGGIKNVPKCFSSRPMLTFVTDRGISIPTAV